MQRLVVPASRGLAQSLEHVAGVPVREQEGGLVMAALFALAGAAVAIIVIRNFDVLYDRFFGRGK